MSQFAGNLLLAACVMAHAIALWRVGCELRARRQRNHRTAIQSATHP